MIHRPLTRLLGLALALTLAACAAYQAQHTPPAPSAAAASPGNPDAELAAILPPSGAFSELTTDGQIARIRGEVEQTRDVLAEEGKYACCVQPACTECLLKHHQCHCREHIHQQGPCGECTQGWIEGRGAVEGIDARDLLARKKQMFDDMNKGHSNP
jgi:hypothetical protein